MRVFFFFAWKESTNENADDGDDSTEADDGAVEEDQDQDDNDSKEADTENSQESDNDAKDNDDDDDDDDKVIKSQVLRKIYSSECWDWFEIYWKKNNRNFNISCICTEISYICSKYRDFWCRPKTFMIARTLSNKI